MIIVKETNMNKSYESSKKLAEYKSRFIYFNHHQELQTFDDINWNLVPKEYRVLMQRASSYEVLAYYNSLCGFYLADVEGGEENNILLSAIEKLSEKDCEYLKKKIKETPEIWDKLLLRSNSTYNIYLDRSKSKLTQNLLHIFSSYYENTEMLFLLFWIVQCLINEPLIENFDKYKDSYNNYKKGVLINDILKKLTKLPEFKKIIERAYFKKLRHITFHNDAILNDDTELITSIENKNIKINYNDAFKTFYAMQQLQNFIRMFTNLLVIEDKMTMNEGIFSSFISEYKNGDLVLELIQLFPFYNYDEDNGAQIKELSVRKVDNCYIFRKQKDIISVVEEPLINKWYTSNKNKKLLISSVYPHIKNEVKTSFIVDTLEYGSFSLGNSCQVHNYV